MTVLALVGLQASDGLVVALVVKHAGNVVKAFATSAAIVLTCVVAALLNDFTATALFAGGAMLVVAASAAWMLST